MRAGMSGRLLVMFDLDGTLVDSCRDLATAVNLMRRHYHLPPLPLDTVKGFVGNGVRMLVARALEGTGVDVDEALAIQKPLYLEHLTDESCLYPGVEAGLALLKQEGHALAVATNKPAEACDRLLAHLGILPLFDVVMAGGRVPVLKPDPDMLLAIIAATGVAARASWMVGDNHTDLESARRAGCRSLFLTYGYGVTGGESPTVTCGSFPEALEVIRRQPV